MVALTVVHTVTGALVLAVTLVTALISYRMLGNDKVVGDSALTREQVAH
jgi:cytochrome bd-type quinol oxidase subunit 1